MLRSPESESGRLFECVRVFDAQPTPAPYTMTKAENPILEIAPVQPKSQSSHLPWLLPASGDDTSGVGRVSRAGRWLQGT